MHKIFNLSPYFDGKSTSDTLYKQLLTLEPRESDDKLPIWLYLIINDKRSCDIDVDASFIFGSGDNFSFSPLSKTSTSSS